jgi:putative selenate reductase
VAGAAGAPPDAAAPLRGWPGVFLAGDALRGADTLVAAMGDGRQAARGILAHLGLADRAARDRAAAGRDPRPADDAAWQDRAARRADPVRPPVRAATGPGDFDLVIGELTPAQAQQEAARCLDCSVRCDVCVSVCPDRANVVFASRPRRWPLARLRPRPGGWAREPEGEFVLEQERQTANLVDLCNQCGNCATFCPTAGAPYRDKPRIALSEAAYAGEALAGAEAIHRLVRHGDALSVRRRTAGQEVTLTRRGDRYTYRTPTAEVTLEAGTFAVTAASFQTTGTDPVSLRPAAELAVLLEGLADHPLVGEPEV